MNDCRQLRRGRVATRYRCQLWHGGHDPGLYFICPTHGGAGSAPPCAVRRACELSRGGAHRHVLLRLRGPCLLPGICVEIQSGEPVGVALKCNPGGLWVMRRICLSEESAIEKSSFEYIIVEDF